MIVEHRKKFNNSLKIDLTLGAKFNDYFSRIFNGISTNSLHDANEFLLFTVKLDARVLSAQKR